MHPIAFKGAASHCYRNERNKKTLHADQVIEYPRKQRGKIPKGQCCLSIFVLTDHRFFLHKRLC